MNSWLVLHHKIPSKPTSSRVYVWRKMKRLRAVLLHDSVWVLPATSRTKEQFQWLVAEIVELGGEAMLWESHLIEGQEEKLVEFFLKQVESDYAQILHDLALEEADLVALSQRYQQIRVYDYFHSKIGEQVYQQLRAARSRDE